MLALALLLFVQTADSSTITQTELTRREQAMVDSLPAGDKKPWDLYLASDVMVHDEKGNSFDKTAMLADVEPMPAGYGGTITLKNIQTIITPTAAIFSCDQDETETVYGAVLHARYHETNTWLFRNGKWQIAASQVLRYYEDPEAGKPNPALFDDYLGTYELHTGIQMKVTRQGDKLFAQRGTGKPVELLTESGDVYFRTGVEGRRLFHRDEHGKVDQLIDRRNNEDLVWKKVS